MFDDDGYFFTGSSYCVWQGPKTLWDKFTLHDLYSRTVGEQQMVLLELFFHKFLGISSVSIDGLIQSLEGFRDDDDTDCKSSDIFALYKYLDEEDFPAGELRYAAHYNQVIQCTLTMA